VNALVYVTALAADEEGFHDTCGKLVALAVSTPQRSSALPDVPTTIEAGYKNSDYTFWTGLFVPAKTPREIVDKLAQMTSAPSSARKRLRAAAALESFRQRRACPLKREVLVTDGAKRGIVPCYMQAGRVGSVPAQSMCREKRFAA
jgi:Tripartite tricarboxylate transporter family receptor